jgi:excisionase family DNA binding protein
MLWYMSPTMELLTEREVAARLRVAPSTVGRWAARGLIPVIVLPSGRRRFRLDDVERLTLPTSIGLLDDGTGGAP